MINPPQVLPEEPTAVTPHGGFCGGQEPAMAALPDNAARPVLCGGCPVMGIPTAIPTMPGGSNDAEWPEFQHWAVSFAALPRTRAIVLSTAAALKGLCRNAT
jgi:hypothetical protein